MTSTSGDTPAVALAALRRLLPESGVIEKPNVYWLKGGLPVTDKTKTPGKPEGADADDAATGRAKPAHAEAAAGNALAATKAKGGRANV